MRNERKVWETLKNVIEELERVESSIYFLEKELREYEEIIDKNSLIPKEKFAKIRIPRLIERLKYFPDEVLVGVRISFSIADKPEDLDEREIIKDVFAYIDSHIRPSDFLFELDEKTLGILFTLKDKSHLELLLKRLENLLLEFKTKIYSSKRALVNYQVKNTVISIDDNPEVVLSKLKEG